MISTESRMPDLAAWAREIGLPGAGLMGLEYDIRIGS